MNITSKIKINIFWNFLFTPQAPWWPLCLKKFKKQRLLAFEENTEASLKIRYTFFWILAHCVEQLFAIATKPTKKREERDLVMHFKYYKIVKMFGILVYHYFHFHFIFLFLNNFRWYCHFFIVQQINKMSSMQNKWCSCRQKNNDSSYISNI